MRATGEAIETVAAAGGVQLGGEMDDWPHDRRGDAPPKQSGRGTPMMPTSFSREVFVCTVVGLVILICGLFLFARKTSLAIDVSLGPVLLVLALAIGMSIPFSDAPVAAKPAPDAPAPTTPTTIGPSTTSASTTVPAPTVEITSPRSGQRVPAQGVEIRGRSSHLQGGREIWVVVVVRGIGKFYPQDGPVTIAADGDWTSLPVFFGYNRDAGRRFDALAVIAKI